MAVFAVGSGLPIRPRVPTYVWTGGHALILPLDRITGDELRAVKKGEAEFAVVEDGPVAALLFRFGDALPWSDAAFNILDGGRLSAEALASIESTSLGSHGRSLLTAILVERCSNIVQAIRVTTLSRAMSREMLDVLRRQIAFGPISDPEMRARASALYEQYPTSEAMLPAASARCIGGIEEVAD